MKKKGGGRNHFDELPSLFGPFPGPRSVAARISDQALMVLSRERPGDKFVQTNPLPMTGIFTTAPELVTDKSAENISGRCFDAVSAAIFRVGFGRFTQANLMSKFMSKLTSFIILISVHNSLFGTLTTRGSQNRRFNNINLSLARFFRQRTLH